jgi:uncharacterized membrane protein
VSLDDWLLALHVLSAFALVAGTVLFWVLIAAIRSTDSAAETVRMGPVVMIGNVATGVGAVGTLVFGLWLAISLAEYDLWDGWVIAALVLWALAMGTGQRTGVAYTAGMRKAEELEAASQPGPNAELLALNRTQNGVVLHALTSILVLLLLVVMIWKPGA